ncbi:MAG: hypothetical protein QX197_00460 [Methylococcaceae bacterium]
MADFGADHAFGQVPKKLKEHYGIVVSISTIAKVTEYHGQQMQKHTQKHGYKTANGGIISNKTWLLATNC